MTTVHAALPDGIYVPMLTFFDSDDKVDLPAVQALAARLLDAGVSGLVLHGSNGEAPHLSHDEKVQNIKAVASVVANKVPLIAGCNAQSVRETVELCSEAAAAGATHALVLPPGYYGSLLDKALIKQFFRDVADNSPIPLLIYNFPGACGVDLNSDEIIELAGHDNIVGVKLTCGNTGKLARIAAATQNIQKKNQPSKFFVGGGSADFILQGAVVGAHGSICGLANLSPRACKSILDAFHDGNLAKARALQAVVAAGDWLAIRYGFVGVKHGIAAFGSFGANTVSASAAPRRPCQGLTTAAKGEFNAGTADLLGLERELSGL
ncbi:dihydrodipicolinate synthase [Ophiostoma piceae UAMH 11346]|uniref:Dihydrodipicolinate synthase n=1 Tax=Ophiostoma piceae (strain UAMH 11346) TaxID=1262450 RepID=S3BXM9_OPHP1|nr:dihydrodipicolinate synthase [Ophiostoma piceae UAMH 11346]